MEWEGIPVDVAVAMETAAARATTKCVVGWHYELLLVVTPAVLSNFCDAKIPFATSNHVSVSSGSTDFIPSCLLHRQYWYGPPALEA
jgi:cbb3-type cytochrome oxidase subunit 1